MHVAMLLEMAAEADGERLAVGPRKQGLTTSELLRGAHRVASLLRRKGHANVAYIGQNSEVVPLLLFGAAFAGVPLAPLNYRLDDDHLRSILASLAPALAAVEGDMVERVRGVEGVELMTRDDLLAALPAEGDGPFDEAEIGRRRHRRPALHERHDGSAEGRRAAAIAT